MKVFICNSEGVSGYTLYIIYTREVIVFAMRTDFPFLLYQDKRKGNEKKKSRLRLRGYYGTVVLALKNELAPLHCAQTAFFSAARPFLRSRPYA